MTRATKQTSVPAPVDIDAEHESITLTIPRSGPALRLAKATAIGVAKGTGSLARGGAVVGGYLLSQGCALAQSALARAAESGVAPVVDEETVIAAVAPSHRGRRVRRFVVFGALGAAAVAGVVVWRRRHAEPEQVADQPPSLRDLEAVES
ncbi:hypothetical protein GCM10023094_38940 [Rhodococcus olei]|uniref:Cell wall synthesis and cell shape protein A n=1 Tax=Rhodococcus olei TaxID=2161675 RepID=A0ABP8PEI5_9NOCA